MDAEGRTYITFYKGYFFNACGRNPLAKTGLSNWPWATWATCGSQTVKVSPPPPSSYPTATPHFAPAAEAAGVSRLLLPLPMVSPPTMPGIGAVQHSTAHIAGGACSLDCLRGMMQWGSLWLGSLGWGRTWCSRKESRSLGGWCSREEDAQVCSAVGRGAQLHGQCGDTGCSRRGARHIVQWGKHWGTWFSIRE